jgi:hypothetical protein
MDQKLADILRRKQKQASDGDTIDWDERRDAYISAVKQLYDQIEEVLAEPIKQRAVKAYRRDKPLSETYLGTYAVPDLVLTIGDEQVRFSPQGRNVVGAKGRVDVIGGQGEAKLILQDNDQWGFVQTTHPKLHVLPLDEPVLAEVLQLVMRD